MSDKILYTGGPNPFKGLIGLPEPPKSMRYTQAWLDYNQQVESIKSNAPDIVNIEAIPVRNGYLYSDGLSEKLKPGDIFDLPVGYEFKKEDQFDGWEGPEDDRYPKYKPVLRIVKTEVKEELIDAVNDSYTLICPACGEILPRNFGLPEPEESQKDLELELVDFFHPYFTEVSNSCRRGHNLNGRKMNGQDVDKLLAKIRSDLPKVFTIHRKK